MTLVYHTPLTSEQQIAAGITAPQPLALADRVRFAELDILNHVNNASYMVWFESLRIRYVHDWGMAGVDLDSPPRIVIRSGEVHYRREMLQNEDYIATCRCTAYRNTSFSLNQQIWSNGTLRASFDCVIVLLHPDGSGRYPIPAPVRARFGTVDKAVLEA